MSALLDKEIVTERLLMRPLADTDAPIMERLAGDERVARFTARIPHPYPQGAAAKTIAEANRQVESGTAQLFAITLKEDPASLIGMIGLEDIGDGQIEIGYWLGVPYWGRGLMSEAAKAVAAFGLKWRPEATIVTHTFPENVASQRVLEKAGFVRRGAGVCNAPARERRRIEDAPIFVFAPDGAA
jgi:RimJ/RimL family protein N-acetyltransferase